MHRRRAEAVGSNGHTRAPPEHATSDVEDDTDLRAGDPNGPPSRRHLWVGIVLYGVLALTAYLPAWPGRAGSVPWCACDDTAQSIWFLDWTPFAILHGHNVLVSNWLDVPGGFNLAQHASMPLLGLLAAPLTLALGPVASFNFLLWLALTASASTCFLALLHWTRWKPAAFVGGCHRVQWSSARKHVEAEAVRASQRRK